MFAKALVNASISLPSIRISQFAGRKHIAMLPVAQARP